MRQFIQIALGGTNVGCVVVNGIGYAHHETLLSAVACIFCSCAAIVCIFAAMKGFD